MDAGLGHKDLTSPDGYTLIAACVGGMATAWFASHPLARLVRVLQTALADSRSFAWRILEACSQQKPVACRRDFRTNSMGSTSTRWPSMSKGGRVTMICAGLSWGNSASMP